MRNLAETRAETPVDEPFASQELQSFTLAHSPRKQGVRASVALSSRRARIANAPLLTAAHANAVARQQMVIASRSTIPCSRRRFACDDRALPVLGFHKASFAVARRTCTTSLCLCDMPQRCDCGTSGRRVCLLRSRYVFLDPEQALKALRRLLSSRRAPVRGPRRDPVLRDALDIPTTTSFATPLVRRRHLRRRNRDSGCAFPADNPSPPLSSLPPTEIDSALAVRSLIARPVSKS